MKVLTLLTAVCLLAATVHAGEPSEADKKWTGAVEKMIAEGPTTVSTSDENRVKLAQELAAKHGRECQVEKNGTTFKVVIHAARKVAKN